MQEDYSTINQANVNKTNNELMSTKDGSVHVPFVQKAKDVEATSLVGVLESLETVIGKRFKQPYLPGHRFPSDAPSFSQENRKVGYSGKMLPASKNADATKEATTARGLPSKPALPVFLKSFRPAIRRQRASRALHFEYKRSPLSKEIFLDESSEPAPFVYFYG